jgi:hypothetical protein
MKISKHKFLSSVKICIAYTALSYLIDFFCVNTLIYSPKKCIF